MFQVIEVELRVAGGLGVFVIAVSKSLQGFLFKGGVSDDEVIKGDVLHFEIWRETPLLDRAPRTMRINLRALAMILVIVMVMIVYVVNMVNYHISAAKPYMLFLGHHGPASA